jgi:hypothetical protein
MGTPNVIVCTPPQTSIVCSTVPTLLGYDPMDYLTGRCNTAIACWPEGKAPGAPTTA